MPCGVGASHALASRAHSSARDVLDAAAQRLAARLARARAPERPSGLTATISVYISLNADFRQNLTALWRSAGRLRCAALAHLRYRVWGRRALSPELTEHAAALADLCRRYRVQRLELFGSAATGQDDPARSDLDFLVEFEPLAEGTYADAYFGVLEGLEAMFRRPVDLVVDSAIRNRYFRESVDRTKTLLYAA
jgi:predicted nucleotidyltransferase